MEAKNIYKSSFKQFISVILALFLRELKTRFGKNRFGVFWTIAEPALHIVILLILFVFIRGRMMPQVPFELFLLTGLVPFFILRNIVKGLMSAASANKALFAYAPVKPIDVYITRMILEVIIYSVIFTLILFCFWFWGGFDISIADPFGFVSILLLITIMGFAFGMIASILENIFPTTKIVVNTIFRFLYFASAIMYPLWIIPGQYIPYLEINPILHLIELFRSSFFTYYPKTNGINIYYPLCITVIALFIGLYFYRVRRFALAAK